MVSVSPSTVATIAAGAEEVAAAGRTHVVSPFVMVMATVSSSVMSARSTLVHVRVSVSSAIAATEKVVRAIRTDSMIARTLFKRLLFMLHASFRFIYLYSW